MPHKASGLPIVTQVATDAADFCRTHGQVSSAEPKILSCGPTSGMAGPEAASRDYLACTPRTEKPLKRCFS
ncbi:hypothetical protein SBA1_740007 [Candidatus Sulfotelmatobacter kueseliae]|uniref:Uncharacterized protein n=1 Tax=Candidatus Sulfotelmatobacter kueseliae TaxID=2042962 RepID=A0A2U3L653_9BACT|nr:hypothetical protein SBA1_740007 [Candidatus Sulfotelmatobacter kueseliae]